MSKSFKPFFRYILLFLLLVCTSFAIAENSLPDINPPEQAQTVNSSSIFKLKNILYQNDFQTDMGIFFILFFLITAFFYIIYINLHLRNEIKHRRLAEKTLREEYQSTQFWLKTLLKHSPDVICFKDAKGRWLEANPADLELFQLQDTDYRGKTNSELAQLTMPLYQDVFLTCEVSDSETWKQGKISHNIETIPRPDKLPVNLDVIKIPLFDAQKEPSGLLVIGRDISEHITAQEQLTSLNHAYKLTNQIRHVIIHAKTEALLLDKICQLIIQQKEFCLAWIGIKETDTQQTIRPVAQAGLNSHFLNTLTICCEDDLSPAIAIRSGVIHQSQQSCSNMDLQDEQKKQNCQSVISLPIKVKDSVWGVLVLYHTGLNNSSLHLLESLANDVGFGIERIQARSLHQKITKQAEESNQFLHTVIDSLTHPFMVINAHTYAIEIANKAARNLAGNITNKSCYQISHHRDSPCDSTEHPCPLATMRKTLCPTMVEHIHYNTRGDEMNVEVHSFPIINARGELERFIEYALDITQRKQAEKKLLDARNSAEAGNRAKSAFLANMSHEIRTPMNAIIGMSGLALQSVLPAKQQDQINKVHQSAKSLIGILNDILDLSKIDAEKLELEQIDFNLETVLNNLHSIIALKAEEKGLKLTIQLDPEVPVLLKGDPLRLGQILTNLCNNAVKFTHEGSINIEVNLIEQLNEQIQLAFIITDTGIGISQAQQKKLFHPFTQADSSTTRYYGGSGLGLAICKKLTDLMGGEIHLDSELDKGSCFYFSLTFAPGIEVHTMQKFNNHGDAVKQLRGARILLVEDNALNQELASELLSLHDMQISTAWNGKEALELLEKQSFDGVLMDIQMPVMDGYEASRQIRQQPRFKSLPIIAMTANVMTGDRDQAKAAGMDAHISKPLNAKQMLTTMAQWIKPAQTITKQEDEHKKPGHTASTELISTNNEHERFAVLTGIDTLKGLANTLNNSSLYQQLLGYFYTDLQQFIEDMLMALNNADEKLAIRLAHSLKGTAATIGADAVSQAAKKLEYACKEAQEPAIIEELLQQAKNTIKVVKQGLDVFFAETTAKNNTEDKTSTSSPVYTRRAETTLKDEQLAVKSLAEDLTMENMAGVIFFCSAEYNLEKLEKALAHFFNCPLMGCTTAGEIGSTYQQGGIVAASFSADVFCFHNKIIKPLENFNSKTARDLALNLESELQFSRALNKNKMLGFLLIDGLSMQEENTITSLYNALGDIGIIGGSAGDNMLFQKTSIFADGQFHSNAAVFGLIETKLPFSIFKQQHFKPSTKEVIITRSDTDLHIVYEINGESAATAYAKAIGLSIAELSPQVFSQYPLIMEIAGNSYVRSIQSANADGSLTFFCAIDDGLPMAIGQAVNVLDSLRQIFDVLQQELADIDLTLGCECLLRLLENQKSGQIKNIEPLLREMNFLGFNSFGEQYNALHVNQTLTGVAFGKTKRDVYENK